jgi:hypothetical protein
MSNEARCQEDVYVWADCGHVYENDRVLCTRWPRCNCAIETETHNFAAEGGEGHRDADGNGDCLTCLEDPSKRKIKDEDSKPEEEKKKSSKKGKDIDHDMGAVEKLR